MLLLAVAALLAGCTTPATTPLASDAASGATAAPGGASTVATLAAAAPPFDLFMTPDLALAPEAAAEGSVTLTTPVNGPDTPGYPQWEGTLPRAVNLTSAGVPVTIYIRASTASVRANQVPIFDAPAFYLGLQVGEKELRAEADGPPMMLAGEVYEVVATVGGDSGIVAAGEAVTFRPVPIYTHVAHAAQFEFVMGPDQPSRLTFG